MPQINKRTTWLLFTIAVPLLIGLTPLRKHLVVYPYRTLLGATADAPSLAIKIQPEHWATIESVQQQALAAGVLSGIENDYVPAEVFFNDQTYEAKVRLKGDHPDHFTGSRWSFRIKLKDDNTILGLKRFSLQDPKTRNYLHEWIFHQLLKEQGLIHLDYHFVDVQVNGESKGTYALEEHFQSRLMDKMQLERGVIIRFDETAFWTDREGEKTAEQHAAEAPIKPYNKKAIKQNPDLKDQRDQATLLLDQNRTGARACSQIYDVQQLATMMALSDICGSYHAQIWHNRRYYFHPNDSLLHPVGFDAMGGDSLRNLIIHNAQLGALTQKTLFQDPVLLKAYRAEIQRLGKPEWLERFFENHQEEMDHWLALIYRNKVRYKFSPELYLYNQRKMVELLPSLDERIKLVSAAK